MRNISFVLIICFMAAAIGCASYYDTIKESGAAGDLKAYDTVSVGWLDLGEKRWKDYGYDESTKGNWTTTIYHMNRVAMPDYLHKLLPDKKTSVAESKTAALPRTGLVIKFTDVLYVQRTSTAAKVMFGAFAGSDTLDLTVHFIDGKSGKELYATTISVSSKAAVDYSGWGFEGRLNNCVYNLVYFISEKVE